MRKLLFIASLPLLLGLSPIRTDDPAGQKSQINRNFSDIEKQLKKFNSSVSGFVPIDGSVSMTGTLSIGVNSGAYINNPSIYLNGRDESGEGGYAAFYRGSHVSYVGYEAPIFGDNVGNFVIFPPSGYGLRLCANGDTTPALEIDTSQNLIMRTGKRFYWDTGVHTYTFESSDNVLDTYVGNSLMLRINTDVATTGWTEYSATSTVVGWSSTTTKEIYYKTIGKMCFVNFKIDGTSNSGTTTFTLPINAAAAPSIFDTAMGYTIDNSVQEANGTLYILANGSTVYLNRVPGVAWTTSGQKAVYGQFWYQTQ